MCRPRKLTPPRKESPNPRPFRHPPGRLPALAVGTGLLLLLPSATATELDLERGRAIFEIACAVCHGPDGHPDPGLPGAGLLDPPPADFTDPLFNSREPVDDWVLVTRHGGAPIGLSGAMPAYGDAYSDEEIRNVVGYLKTLAGPHRYPPGDLNFLLAFRTKKAWIEDEVVYASHFTRRRDGVEVFANSLRIEKRFFARWQGELKVSHEFDDGRDHWDEVEVGVKYALYDSLRHMVLLSGGMDTAISLRPGNSVEAIPFLALAKGLGDPFTLQTSLRSHLPVDRLDSGDVELAAAVHWIPTPWPRGVFPGLELTARVPFASDDRDAVRWTVLPQLNFGLSRRGHVRAAAGVELPLNDRDYDYRMHFYVMWDFADGMFWEGWRMGRTRVDSPYE